MEPLLFLCHRLPFPPNKGDKVRSNRYLRFLSQRYRVLLGTFIDDAADLAHVDAVRAMCADLHVSRLDPTLARARSLMGLLNGEALTLPYYRNAALTAWVERVVAAHDVRNVLVYSSAMAQFVPRRLLERTVVDFVDLDSAKWTAYSRSRRWPLSWIYAREGERLLTAERSIAASTAASVFVTQAEVELFLARAPEAADRTTFVENGVDAEFFSPAHAFASPYPEQEIPVVFTGAMDYWPNIDAVRWFADHCLEPLRARLPNVRFYIVGMNPAKSVQQLADREGIVVTGRVPDVRPWLAHARVAVAPLRVARGIQNKILEAMAMALPVITTSDCAHALRADLGQDLALADTPAQWVNTIEALLDPDRHRRMGARARSQVLAEYSWERNLERLASLFPPAPTPVAQGGHAQRVVAPVNTETLSA